MRTLATWLDGRILEAVRVRARGDAVRGRRRPRVPVRRRAACSREFAPGTMFQALGFDSYAAYALNDAAGEPARADRSARPRPDGRPRAHRGDAEDLRRARRGGARAHARRGGAPALGGELPLDLRGERGPDLRARLGHRRDPRREPQGGGAVRLHARGDAATHRRRRERERAALHQAGRRAPHPAGEAARRAGPVRVARPAPGRPPDVARGDAQARDDRRRAADPRVHPRRHRAQARRRGAARERGAVPRDVQRHRRRRSCCATPTTASST